MIWNIGGHELALTGLGQAYEDSFENFLRLICGSCWEGVTKSAGHWSLWADPWERNPLDNDVDIDYSEALNALRRHLDHLEIPDDILEAAITMAALADELEAGLSVIREQTGSEGT